MTLDDEAALRSLLSDSTPDEAYAIVSEDVERLIWQLALWPTSHQPQRQTPRINQIGVIMEVMPNVYAQSLTIIQEMVPYRSIQVWGQAQGADGVERRLELLNMRSDEFPDEATLALRPGMQRNLTWYLDIRRHLRAALERRRQRTGLGAPGANAELAPAGQTTGGGSLALPTEGGRGVLLPLSETQRLLRLGDADGLFRMVAQTLLPGDPSASLAQRASGAPAASMRAPGAPPFYAAGYAVGLSVGGALGAQPEASPTRRAASERELADLRGHLQQLFEEWKTRRDEAYSQRDQCAHKLREAYFTVYPIMREASKASSTIDIDKAVLAWVEEGFPQPDPERAPSLPPGVAPEVVAAGADRQQQIAHALAEAQRLAAAMREASLQARERAEASERLCVLSGGHQVRQDRDRITGSPRLVCERCNAALSASFSEQQASFLL